MTSNVTQNPQNLLPDKSPATVEKDVRKWVESICEFKANLEMEKCEVPTKKIAKKVRKYKIKKKLSVNSTRPNETNTNAKGEQKTSKAKVPHKKEATKEKTTKEGHPSPPAVTVFENLRNHYKSAKLPTNWVSGQSRTRLVFCRVRVISHGSQYEMITDRGIAITNDCMIHVFVEGPEVNLNWKKQKVETIDDIRKAIKAIDGLKICTGTSPGGLKSPTCSIFLTGDSKQCQACKSEMTQMKVSGVKVKGNPKTTGKASSFQK